MIYRHDSGKRLSRQNHAKFAPCRKNLRREDNYPPRRFKRHVEPESDDCERWFTGGFTMKNWCSFDAMTVRKRTDLRLLSDLLSPISEPWNDVFQTQEKPVNALLKSIYGLFSNGRGKSLEPSARGFGGNVEISLTLRLLPDFGDLLPAAPLMLQGLMLFWWYELISVRPERSKFTPH